jgi:hypothetical protein
LSTGGVRFERLVSRRLTSRPRSVSGAVQSGNRRRNQRKGDSGFSLVVHLARQAYRALLVIREAWIREALNT